MDCSFTGSPLLLPLFTNFALFIERKDRMWYNIYRTFYEDTARFVTSFANKVSFYVKNTENTLLYDILYFKSFLGESKEVDWS